MFDLRSPVAHRVEFLRFLRALACPQSPVLERDADSYYTNMVIGDTRFWLGEPLHKEVILTFFKLNQKWGSVHDVRHASSNNPRS